MNPLSEWWRLLPYVQRWRLARIFKAARGKQLDAIGTVYGVDRLPPKRWWWPFKESDRAYRARMLAFARGMR